MSGPNTNATDRLPTTHNPARYKDIYQVSDWGTAITAPDGVSRVPFENPFTYRVHNDVELPRMLLPIVVEATQFNFVDIVAMNASVTLLFDGDATAHIWGRNVGSIRFIDIVLLDIGDSEAGEVTDAFDLVGFGSSSFFAMQFCVISGFRRTGHFVNMFQDLIDCELSGNLGGMVARDTFEGQTDHLFIAVVARHPMAGGTPEKPVYAFLGTQITNQVSASQIGLNAGQDFIYLDSDVSGAISIVNNQYGGADQGDFFATPDVEGITGQSNADIAFISVAAGGAGESVITFAAIQDFVVGQIVLIKGDTGTTYDGLFGIISVSDDQKSFTIQVTFVATDSGNFKIVRHTFAGPNPYVRDATITVSGTTNYNGTLKILRETNTSFDLPQTFNGDDATGSATTNPKNNETVGIKAFSNGQQADSCIVAESNFLNTAGETITINTLGVAEKIGTVLWTTGILERISVSTAGLHTYLGETAKDILINFTATVERVTGTPTLGIGVGLFKDGVLISGFEYARSFNAGKVQISGARIVDVVQNSTFEIVVINFDNTVNIDVFQAAATVNQTA